MSAEQAGGKKKRQKKWKDPLHYSRRCLPRFLGDLQSMRIGTEDSMKRFCDVVIIQTLLCSGYTRFSIIFIAKYNHWIKFLRIE